MDDTPLTVVEDFDDRLISSMSDRLVESSLGEAAKARFVEGWERNITGSLIREFQLEEEGYSGEDTDYLAIGDTGMDTVPEAPKITKQEWEDSPNYREDLEFQDNMTEGQAKVLAELKDAENKRKQIVERANLNAYEKTLLFGVDLAAAAVDPLNVALAFVPIVGEARMAAMVARFGVTRARLIAGSIEGVGGALIAEPFIYASAQKQQADYDLMDSLFAVGLGGVFGAGAHAGLGRIGDALGISYQARTKALQAALNQAEEGLDVKIDPVLKADLGQRVADSDLDIPKPVGYDESFSKAVDDILALTPEDTGLQRQIYNMQQDMDEMFQMVQNGVLDEQEYLTFRDEMIDVVAQKKVYSDAVDAAFSCIVRK
jgi:hypothetical protein